MTGKVSFLYHRYVEIWSPKTSPTRLILPLYWAPKLIPPLFYQIDPFNNRWSPEKASFRGQGQAEELLSSPYTFEKLIDYIHLHPPTVWRLGLSPPPPPPLATSVCNTAWYMHVSVNLYHMLIYDKHVIIKL